MKRWLGVVLTALLLPAAAQAQNCAGFNDVVGNSVFCPNVEWLKNRAITLGCSSSTLYCPTDVVSRLAMAAFMNRLGVALTPAVVYADDAGGSLDLDGPAETVCATATIAPASYPRFASLNAVLAAQFDASAAAAVRLVVSNNDGATWAPLHAQAASAGGADRWAQASMARRAYAIEIGSAYRFGIAVSRAMGDASADVTGWRCQLAVTLGSRNGPFSPY